jgi:hypothetical protein
MLMTSRRPWASFNSPVLHVSKIILIRLKQKESIKFALEVFIYINPSPYLVYRARCEDVAKSLTWEGCPDNIFHLYQLFQLKNYWVPPPIPPVGLSLARCPQILILCSQSRDFIQITGNQTICGRLFSYQNGCSKKN